MAIVGAIQDGIFGDWTILGTKAILDFIIILVMTAPALDNLSLVGSVLIFCALINLPGL